MILQSAAGLSLRLPNGSSTPIGRAHAPKCPEAMFVSRQQCLLTVADAPDGKVQLQHIGGGNPTLVLPANNQPQRLLRTQGEVAQLAVGDAFALVASRPGDALRLAREDGLGAAEGQQQPQQQQQQPQGQHQQQQQRQQPQPQPSTQTPPAAAAAGGAPPAVQPHAAGPVMLVLVGVPGSGKSTWSEQLAARSSRSWVRVNQDSIRGGKRGTRQQCISAARAALAAGRNVIVDRCNVDAEQRSDFMAVAAAAGAPAHCLFLNLHTALCVKRAAGRTGHEGGVDGKAAPRVVNSMAAQLSKAGPISAAAEGFSSITTARNDQQVAAALSTWAAAAVGIEATAVQRQAAAVAAGAAGAGSGRSHTQHAQPGLSAAAAAADEDDAAPLEPPSKRQRSGSPLPGTSPAAPAAAAGAGGQRQQQQQQTAGSPAAAGSRSAFDVLMRGAKQQQQQHASPGSASKPRAAAGSSQPVGGSGGSSRAGGASASGGGSWSSALSQIAANPDRFRTQQTIWHVDEQCVGILDKYPKSSTHALLLARQPGLNAVSELRREHLPLLQHMRAVALRWIGERQQGQEGQGQQVQAAAAAGAGSSGSHDAPSSEAPPASDLQAVPPGWRLGFHSVPSMAQLHLHVLSDDFNSEWLKTKKHWNSFTGPFFLQLDGVMQALQQPPEAVVVDRAAAEALLKRPLACHKCAAQLPNMPQLKAHLLAKH